MHCARGCASVACEGYRPGRAGGSAHREKVVHFERQESARLQKLLDGRHHAALRTLGLWRERRKEETVRVSKRTLERMRLACRARAGALIGGSKLAHHVVDVRE